MKLLVQAAILLLTLARAGAADSESSEPQSLRLRDKACVDGAGVFLNALLVSNTVAADLRLLDAPVFGQTIVLSKARIAELAALSSTNLDGPESVRITRRARKLTEKDVLGLLTSALHDRLSEPRADLELHFGRPWTPLDVPDEQLNLKVLELPAQGITPTFITRFELQTASGETVGNWQVVLQARAWQEIWIARVPLLRGAPLRQSDLSLERRDILPSHERAAELTDGDSALELAEPVSAGMPLLARSIKPKTVIHRGQNVAAVLQDGALAISLKVEAMEDGAPGQIIRVRNPLSRRDLRGKVIDEQQIQVCL